MKIMLSKREKLLIRPWQQRKYENHRRKVQSALPVIDNKPPASREHVLNKLKKHQKEIERCAKIEKDNLTLLRKLSHTMRTSRVDNYWTTPQPNFLSRVPLYRSTPKDDTIIIEEEHDVTNKSSRKARCSACTPKKIVDILIPEERIPWEPEKLPVSRFRSKSVPARKSTLLETITERDSTKKKQPSSASSLLRGTTAKAKRIEAKAVEKSESNVKFGEDIQKSPQSVILSRGCLRLSVNFPSDTVVKFQNGCSEKMLFGGDCFCRKSLKAC